MFLGLGPTQWQAIGSIGTFVAFFAITWTIFKTRKDFQRIAKNLNLRFRLNLLYFHTEIIHRLGNTVYISLKPEDKEYYVDFKN